MVKIFSLVKIEEKGREEEELGGIYFRLTNIRLYDNKKYDSTIEFKFIIAEKFRNKEENFICSVNRGDIINIKSEYEESQIDLLSDSHVSFPISNYEGSTWEENSFSLHNATLTFLFKEMSFPNVLNDD